MGNKVYQEKPGTTNRKVKPPFRKLKEAMKERKFTMILLSEHSGIGYDRLNNCLKGVSAFLQIECDVIIDILNDKLPEEVYTYEKLFRGEPFNERTLTELPKGRLRNRLEDFEANKA